ncbi:hypothetical protein KIPB_013166, partial [Kipferlia bialata]
PMMQQPMMQQRGPPPMMQGGQPPMMQGGQPPMMQQGPPQGGMNQMQMMERYAEMAANQYDGA